MMQSKIISQDRNHVITFAYSYINRMVNDFLSILPYDKKYFLFKEFNGDEI